jgi:tyrosyl-tRNA synthetase
VLSGEVRVVDALAETGLVSSRGEARRTVSQGGAYVNNRRVTDADEALSADDLLHGRYIVLRRGRRQYHLVTVE